jgi:DNA-binding MarR family transcriptional regulator
VPGEPLPEARLRRIRELETLLRRMTVESQRLGHTFADQQRLHPTDLEALIHVMDAEAGGTPLTPGRLAEALGLSPGATTSVIDRLEAQGHLRREPDAHDRRRTHLHFGERGMAVGMAFFGPLGERVAPVMAGFSDRELGVVRRFLDQMAQVMAGYRADLAAGPSAGPWQDDDGGRKGRGRTSRS